METGFIFSLQEKIINMTNVIKKGFFTGKNIEGLIK